MSRAGIKKILFLSVILSGLLAGCSQKEMPRPTPEEGKYLIYYLNTATTKLVPREYEAEATDKEALVDELMEQFLHVPKELDCQAALIDKVAYQGSRQEEQVLYLYFDVNYTGMKPEREILCRAALTRTLTQIPGVDYINIYCGDQPLMDRQGNPVGMLASTDFIMNTSNVNAYEKTELTLYFADETGNKLLEEKREVVHNINTSLEQLVVEQLIAGPGQEGRHPTLPSDCKILSLSVTDNVCYINFDSAFLNTSLPVSEYVPIYSIVDSLSEMTTVTKVQIMVNGSQNVMFRDVISLNTPFEKSQDYIEGAQ
ncbi:GerMN domain-containing protein [Enterocloster citroniae]|uniref:GerMN domain-containing protein n=1 Tax=Enterocloster citroniae TaxID=358743 RepID=UPI0034A498C6